MEDAPHRDTSKCTNWANRLAGWEIGALNFALFGLAQWFFGNLYEQLVSVPNHLFATLEEARIVNGFYRVSSPIWYFVPLTQLASLTTIVLAIRWRNAARVGGSMRWAAILITAALAMTAFIVTRYNLDLFFGELTMSEERYYQRIGQWIELNAVRLVLVGATLLIIARVRLRIACWRGA